MLTHIDHRTMPPKPHIDILMPAYNEALGITRSLNSCLAAVEAITDGYTARLTVVANGCTDNTAEVADTVLSRRLADSSRVDYNIVELPEGHMIKAINRGIEEAEGGITFKMDADVALDEYSSRSLLRVMTTDAPRAVSMYHQADAAYIPDGVLGDIVRMGDLRRQAIPKRYKLHGGFFGWNGRVSSDGMRFPEDKPVSDDTWLSYSLIHQYGLNSVYSENTGIFSYVIPARTEADYVQQHSRYAVADDVVGQCYPELVPTIESTQALQPPIEEINRRWRLLCAQQQIDFDQSNVAYQEVRTKILANRGRALGELLANNGQWAQVASTRMAAEDKMGSS